MNRDPFLIAILLVALAVRVTAIAPVHSGGYTSDEREYIAMSGALAGNNPFIDSNGERSTRAPLFPYALSVLVRLFGPHLTIQHIVGCVLGTLVVMLGYHLSLRIWGARQPALITAGAMAVYPGLVIYSTLLQTETLYIVFVLMAFVSAYRWAGGGGMRFAALMGIAAGLASLTRAVFFGFIPFLFALAWAIGRRQERKGVELGLAVVVCALVLTPWTIRNLSLYGAFVPVSSGGGNSLLYGNNPFATGTWRLEEGFEDWYRERAGEHGVGDITRLDEVQRSSLSGDIAVEYIVRHPWETIRLALKKAHMFLVYPIVNSDSNIPLQLLAVGADVILLIGIGLGLAVAPPAHGRLILVGSALLFFFLVQVVLHAEARFRLPLVPVLSLFFGWGASLVTDRDRLKQVLTNGRSRRLVTAFATGLVMLYGWTAWLFIKGEI